MNHLEKNPMIVMVVGIFGIGVSSILVRYSSAPSEVTAAFRLLWTVLLMTPLVLGKKVHRQELASVGKKDLLFSTISGAFLAVHFVLWFDALHMTSVASAATLVCTEVIWVSLGYCLFLSGRLSGKAVAAIAVTLIGSGCIALADSAAGESHFRGDLLALLAAMAAAVYMLFGRVVQKRLSTTVYTYLVYSACALVLLLFCLVQGIRLFDHGWSGVLVGFLLAVFSTLLGHSIFSWCLKFFSPAFVSAAKLCEPVVAAALAALLFGEVPTAMQLLGGVMILAGVLYYSRIEAK